MPDTLRWALLAFLFLALVGTWLWSQKKSGAFPLSRLLPKSEPDRLKIIQRRWVDQRTGVCLLETEGQRYLLAYTIAGGVSWQPIPQKISSPTESTHDL